MLWFTAADSAVQISPLPLRCTAAPLATCEEIQVYLNVATVTPSPRADAHARPTRGPLPEPHNEPVRHGPTRSAYIARTTAGCTIQSTAVSPDRPPRTQKQCVLVQSRPIDLLRVYGSLHRSPILHRSHASSSLPTGGPSGTLTRARALHAQARSGKASVAIDTLQVPAARAALPVVGARQHVGFPFVCNTICETG